MQGIVDKEGFISIESIADKFHVSVKDIADSTGLNDLSLETKSLCQTELVQKRLREVVDIIDKIIPWCENFKNAYSWYRSEPLPSFGQLTAMELVKQGKVYAVIQYLDRIDRGGFS